MDTGQRRGFLSVAVTILLIAVGLVAWGVFGGAPENRVPVGFKPNRLQLGDVEAGVTLERKVTLINHGAVSARVLGVGTSCGCTSVKRKLAGEVIEPNGELVIRLKVNTEGRTGPIREDVNLWVATRKGEGRAEMSVKGVVN